MSASLSEVVRRRIQLLSLHVSCKLCKLFLEEPYRLVSCGHVVCERCVSGVKKREVCPIEGCGWAVRAGEVVRCRETVNLVQVVQRLREISGVGGKCSVRIRVREKKNVWVRVRLREKKVSWSDTKGGELENGESELREQCAAECLKDCQDSGDGDEVVDSADAKGDASLFTLCTKVENTKSSVKSETVPACSNDVEEKVFSQALQLPEHMDSINEVEIDIPDEPDVDSTQESVANKDIRVNAVVEHVSKVGADASIAIASAEWDIPEEPHVDSSQETQEPPGYVAAAIVEDADDYSPKEVNGQILKSEDMITSKEEDAEGIEEPNELTETTQEPPRLETDDVVGNGGGRRPQQGLRLSPGLECLTGQMKSDAFSTGKSCYSSQETQAPPEIAANNVTGNDGNATLSEHADDLVAGSVHLASSVQVPADPSQHLKDGLGVRSSPGGGSSDIVSAQDSTISPCLLPSADMHEVVPTPQNHTPKLTLRLRLQCPKKIPLVLRLRPPSSDRRRKGSKKRGRPEGGKYHNEEKYKGRRQDEQRDQCEQEHKRLRSAKKSNTSLDKEAMFFIGDGLVKNDQLPTAGPKKNSENTQASKGNIFVRLRIRDGASKSRSGENSPSFKFPLSVFPESRTQSRLGNCAGSLPLKHVYGTENTTSQASSVITPQNHRKLFVAPNVRSPRQDDEVYRTYSPTVVDSESAIDSAGKYSREGNGRPCEHLPMGAIPSSTHGAVRDIGEKNKLQIRQETPFAVCITGMDKDSLEFELAEELLSLQGVEVSDGFVSDPSPSCVLTMFDVDRAIRHPRMVVCEAMARRIPIVDLSWLVTSHRVGFLVHTGPFEALGDHRRDGPGVFEGVIATFENAFDQPEARTVLKMAGQDIRRLLCAGGATVIEEEELEATLERVKRIVLHIHVVSMLAEDGNSDPAMPCEQLGRYERQQIIPPKNVDMGWISDCLRSGQCPPP